MSTTLYDREHAFEAQFAHHEEFRFLAKARRDKLFAQWAATTLRLSGEEENALAEAVLAIPNGPGHDQALIQHVADFLSAHAGGRKGIYWLPWTAVRNKRTERRLSAEQR